MIFHHVTQCERTLTPLPVSFLYIKTTQLTNTLQRKLQVLQHEKAVLGRQMEYEKEENATLRLQLSVLREAQLKKAAPLEDQEEMEEE
jgi:hypothetical protein